MADGIVKLRVDSSEYDAKLKRAADGLRDFGEKCKSAGDTVAKADKDTIAYVRAIGQMDTHVKTAKGSLGEMTKTFTELSMQYRKLTDEEKNTPFGKALSASLDELRTRIIDDKRALEEVGSSLQDTSGKSNETGGVLDALAGKFGLNVTHAGALGAALGMTAAATKVAKDAFFANEQQLDEWGRTITASESVYRGFLNALNNGDISGYLSKIDTIVKAARDAYDALDELATYNAFNQINVEKTRAELSNSINDYREGQGSKQNVKDAGDAVIKELRTRQQKEEKAYKAAVGKLAAERGVSQKDLLDALSGSYGHYSDLKNVKPTGSRTVFYGGGMFGGGGSYQVATPRTRQEQIGQALRKINDTELKDLQALGAQAQRTSIEIAGVERQVIRTMNARPFGGSSSGGVGRSRVTTGGGRGGRGTVQAPPPEGSIAAQEAKVQALTKAWKEATDAAGREGYAAQLEEAKKLLDQMQGKAVEVVPPNSFVDLKRQLADLQKQREMLNDPMEVAVVDDQIDRVNEKIKRLNEGDVFAFSLLVREDEVTAKLEELNERRKQIEDDPIIVEIDADIAKFERELADIRSQQVNTTREQPATITLEQKVRLQVAEETMNTDINALTNLLRVQIENGLEGIDIDSENLQRAILGERIDIPDDYWEGLAEQINAKLNDLGIDPIKLDVKTGNIEETAKATKKSWQDAAQAVQAVGGALQQIEDPSTKIAGLIGQAIANIALGFAQATASDSKLGVLGWIAAITGGMATMISTISAIHNVTGYAEGGIIKGHSYSGDNIMANGGNIGLNAGELILNRAQQGVIANDLRGGSTPVIQIEGVIDGETIRLVQRNNNRRTGRGELVTTKTR